VSDLSRLPTEELLKMYQQPAGDIGSMSTEQLMALYQQQPQGGAMERANSFLGGAVEGMPIVR
jgi:hypothetical protein